MLMSMLGCGDDAQHGNSLATVRVPGKDDVSAQ